MDESSKYIYSLATLLKQHLKVKSFKNEMHCLQEMWKRVLKTQNIIGKKKKHENESQAASGFQQTDLNLIVVKLMDMSFLGISCRFIFFCL